MLKQSLEKTRKSFFGKVVTLLGGSELDDESWEEIEALLIQGDLGVRTALEVVEELRAVVEDQGITQRDEAVDALKMILRSRLVEPPSSALDIERTLSVVLVVGVNGSGKTTTTAKLAHRFMAQGRKVMLAAADTFRAAAVDQLRMWGERLDVPVIAGQEGGDPGAVAYDAIRAARSRLCDLLIIDTAGRLHTRYNLMEELKKVHTVARKNVHEAPHEVWLVLDGTTGQNALVQARKFAETVNVTGIIITKLDGTARGGMVFAINRELGLPVRYIGVGESVDALLPFDPDAFVESLFD